MKNFKLKTLLLSLISASLVIGGMSIGASYMAKGHDTPVEAATNTYTFTSNAWADSTSSWTSGKNGNQLSDGRGVQVTAKTSGANATSKSSFSNVSSVVVTYSTNASSGAGSISIKIGSNTASSQSVTKTGGTTDRNLTYNFSPNQTGKVTLTVTCTTNSIYVKSIAITTGSATTVEATGMSISPSSATVEVGETVTFTPTLTGGSGGYEKTIGWTSSAPAVIAAPSNSEDGNSVTVTALSAGSTTLTGRVVSPGSANATITITVEPAKVLSSIAITTPPTKTTYDQNETFSSAGMVVTATYTKGNNTVTENVTSSCTFSPSGALTPSNTSITVSYTYKGVTRTASQAITVNALPTYRKITSTSGLVSGAEYVIGNSGGTAFMSTQTSNNRAKVDATSSSGVVTWKSGMEKITLGGNATDGWTFYATTETAGYLYAASSSSNYLRTQATNNSNGQWTISIASGGDATVTAKGSNTHNMLRYNSTSSIFSCYSSGQAAITLWKKDVPHHISITSSTTTVKVGNTINITASCDACNTFTYSSSNTSVATINSNGVLTGKSVGNTTITVSCKDHTPAAGEVCSATVNISVTAPTQATSMSFSPSSISMYSGETKSFIPTLTGGDGAYEKTIVWSANKQGVITFPAESEAGVSVSIKASNVNEQTEVTLTGRVTSPGSATASITITVTPTQQATSMTFDPSSISMYGLDTESFTVTLGGGGPGHTTTISWASSHPSIIAAPANSESGDTVSITPNDVVNITEVTLTGTVDIAGGISNTIVITVMPASSKPLPRVAYTLDCLASTIYRDTDDSASMDSKTSGDDYFKEGAEYVDSVDSSKVYLGKTSSDSLKFSSSNNAGSLEISLSTLGQVKATKIVLHMSTWTNTDSGKSDSSTVKISVNGATSGETGYLVTTVLTTTFTDYEVECDESQTIETILVQANVTSACRFYLDYIEIWARPREASSMTFNPTSVTVESGTSTSFIPTLSGGTSGYEQTINWVSSNPSLIPSPKQTEEGENVIISAASGVESNTTVTITGTVASPGYATATINVTITPYVPVDHYTVEGTAYGVEGESKWNLSECTLHAWRDANETNEKTLVKNADYKLNSHTPIRYTDDKTIVVYDALGLIEGEWTVTGKIVQRISDTINFKDVTDTTGGQDYDFTSGDLVVTKGHVEVEIEGSVTEGNIGTDDATGKTRLNNGNTFTVRVKDNCELISVRAYGNIGTTHGIHLHMLSWSGAISTDTSSIGQSYAVFTNKISRSLGTPSSTVCVIQGEYTEIWGLEVVYSLPDPGPEATDPGANADDMIFNDANNTGVSVRTLGYYFAGGTGTSGDPFQIKSPTHLRNLAKLQNSGVMPTGKYFSLENSFNWSGDDMEPIGKDADHAFHGFFRGNCHTIQGLVVTSTYAYAGMFGYVYGGTAGRVTNLILSSPTINCRPTEANTDVRAGFLCGYIGGSVANIVSGIMVFAGNENSGALIKRATITANANAVVDCTDGDSGTNCVIVGGRNSATSIGIVSFVASMNDIVISDGNIIAPKTGTSTQTRFVNQSNFTYTYYRHSGNSGAVVKE